MKGFALFLGQMPRRGIHLFCVCCKSLCSRSHTGCLGVCFFCLVVLECSVPCTIWKEVATDGGFSVWQSAVHLLPCHEHIKICAVLVVYETQRRITKESQRR